MFKVGMLLQCKTKTKNDLFGTVIWKVIEVGLNAPEPGREHLQDGILVEMVGGTGSCARKGMRLTDSEEHINMDIMRGNTKILSDNQVGNVLSACIERKSDVTEISHAGKGCLEI